MLLHDRLHAKYFRSESEVLLGSANLTGAALGWSAPRNLELLIPSPLGVVTKLEDQLRSESIRATATLAHELREIANQLPIRATVAPPDELHSPPAVQRPWLPSFRHPADLWLAYRGEQETLSLPGRSAAAQDLAWLELPGGFDEPAFKRVVAGRLMQHPFLTELDDFLVSSQRFGAVRDFLAARFELDREEADLAWQTLMRWLLEFLPARYTVTTARWSEVIQRRPSREERV
ncbi:hypothetical protein [Nocardioides coralli]|uniref:hypothetical protein n=1 Tax=Nocardioides coralli TaxID=2872154 RepID=UPI001CA4329A|nr:hypothetical protein [Nocardioides coralli]QZY29684.1 hypothetical protein K6T13_03045 [Nocardioides coralli]